MLRCCPRFFVLWWLCCGAALSIAMAPAVSWAQDAATQERLDRLERDLNMLQRQVYRGGGNAAQFPPAPPGSVNSGATNAADIEIRMERLEAQMRDLTGRVEQINNGLDQIKQRVEQINSDIDVRLGQMGGTAAGPAPGRPGAVGSPPAAPSSRQAAGSTRSSTRCRHPEPRLRAHQHPKPAPPIPRFPRGRSTSSSTMRSGWSSRPIMRGPRWR
jgi:tetrahydromethanopterin S-methyltransferase subunit G